MKTVKQQTEVLFQSLDFADKAVMLPIIDAIANILITQDERRTMIIHSCGRTGIENVIAYEQLKKIFKVFSDLGCRTSLGESYEDIIESLNSQEEISHIIHIDNPGQNKLQIIKIIREQLNLGIREAKDLVDSYPVDINFHTYGMPVQGCEILLDLLLKAGCSCYLKSKMSNK